MHSIVEWACKRSGCMGMQRIFEVDYIEMDFDLNDETSGGLMLPKRETRTKTGRRAKGFCSQESGRGNRRLARFLVSKLIGQCLPESVEQVEKEADVSQYLCNPLILDSAEAPNQAISGDSADLVT